LAGRSAADRSPTDRDPDPRVSKEFGSTSARSKAVQASPTLPRRWAYEEANAGCEAFSAIREARRPWWGQNFGL
jgi:hypothetical protein